VDARQYFLFMFRLTLRQHKFNHLPQLIKKQEPGIPRARIVERLDLVAAPAHQKSGPAGAAQSRISEKLH